MKNNNQCRSGLALIIAKIFWAMCVFILVVFSSSIASAQSNDERVFWDAVKSCTVADEVKAYLGSYPDGHFKSEAKACLAILSPDPTAIEAALNLSREDRRLIQHALNARRLNAGVPDGVFGNGTRSAIKRYQKNANTDDTGYLDDTTVKILIVEGRPLAKAARAEENRKREIAARAEAERKQQEVERTRQQAERRRKEAEYWEPERKIRMFARSGHQVALASYVRSLGILKPRIWNFYIKEMRILLKDKVESAEDRYGPLNSYRGHYALHEDKCEFTNYLSDNQMVFSLYSLNIATGHFIVSFGQNTVHQDSLTTESKIRFVNKKARKKIRFTKGGTYSGTMLELDNENWFLFEKNGQKKIFAHDKNTGSGPTLTLCD